MTKEEALKILRYEMQTHIANEVDLHIAMGMAIEALSADHWIPCSERLPDKDGEYIVIQKNGSIGRYVFSCEGNSEEYFKRCAIAWMPLPESWEGGHDAKLD